MPHLALLSSIMAIHLVVVVSPGPNFLIVTQTSIRQTRRSGLVSASGVSIATALWAIAALLGVSLLFETAAWLYSAVKLLGGAYLVYLGIRSWQHAGEPVAMTADEPVSSRSSWHAFRTGFLTNLTNPKAAIFFASIFTALLTPSLPLWVRAAAVGIVFCNALGWYSLVAVVFSTARVQRVYGQAKRYIDRFVGGFLALLGLRLMLSDR